MIRIGLLGALGARWDRISRRWTCGCGAAMVLYTSISIYCQAGLIARNPYENQSMPVPARRQSQFRFPRPTAWPTKAADLVAKSQPNWASRATHRSTGTKTSVCPQRQI